MSTRLIEGVIYGSGAIICFVVIFRIMARHFYNEWPKNHIDGEEIAVSVIVSVFAAAFWFIFLPIVLIYILCRELLLPLILPKDVKMRTKRKSWIRKDS